MLRQALSIGITALLLSTGTEVEARRRRRRNPHPHPVPHPRPVPRPHPAPPRRYPQPKPVQAGSGLELRQTPFPTVEDYASWTKYVGDKLYQAGDRPRLEKVIDRLNRLVRDFKNPTSRASVDQAARDQRQRASQMRSTEPSDRNYRYPVDREADRLFDLIQRGYYHKAEGDARNLLDRQDYVKLSTSMKYVIILAGLIQYDGLNPKAVLPIWFDDWNLNLNEKISALIRAKQLCQRTSQGQGDPRQPGPFRPFARINQVDALVLANLGRDVTGQFRERYLQGSTVEQDTLRAGMELGRGNYCRARDIIRNLARHLARQSLRHRDTSALGARANEMCARVQLDNTYRAFCQVGHEAALPIGEALSQTCHKPHIAGDLERMFWLRTTAGDCNGARDELRKVRNAIPWQVAARHDYLNERLRYMDDQLRRCRPRPMVLVQNNRVGERLMASLWRKNLTEAERTWQAEFGRHPLDLFAMLWRKVLLVARYPKAMYAPCTGNTILTGDGPTDRDLFVKLETIKANQGRAPCNQPNPILRDRCNLLWMKAAYIADNVGMAREYGEKIKTDQNACNEAHQLMACVNLCGTGQGGEEACVARQAYNQLSVNFKNMPQNKIGADLANKLCALRGQLVLDSLYIRHGPTIHPLSSLFRRLSGTLHGPYSLFPQHEARAPVQPQRPGLPTGSRPTGYHPAKPAAHPTPAKPAVHPSPAKPAVVHPSPVKPVVHPPIKPQVAPAHPTPAKPQPASPVLHPFGQMKPPTGAPAKIPKKTAKKAAKKVKEAAKQAKKAAKQAKKAEKGAKKAIARAQKRHPAIVHPEELRIKLPKAEKHVALLQAQAALCPCMKVHYKAPVPKCNPEANRLKLVKAFARFLKLQHIGGCCQHPPAPVIKKYAEKELAQSGAMQVAADLFAKGKLRCPCFKVHVVQKHKIRFNPPLACNCPCLRAPPPKPIVKTVIKTVTKIVPKPIAPPPQVIPHLVAHVQKHATPPCARALIVKFPFLKDLMGGGKTKPCRRMSKKVRKLFEEMIREVEADCQSGMAQAMMHCHQQHTMQQKH